VPLDLPSLLVIAQNVAVLLVLSFLHDLLLGHLPATSRRYQVGTGVLFGLTAIGIMLVASEPVHGIRIDGRTAIIAAASVFGGLPSGTLAAIIASLGRLAFGGIGAPIGVVSIALAAVIGSVFNWLGGQLVTRIARSFWPLVIGSALGITNFVLAFAIPGRPLEGHVDGVAPLIASFVLGYPLLAYLLGRERARAMAEAALGDERRRFRAIFDQNREFLAILDPAGNVIELNSTIRATLGSDLHAVGKPFWSIGLPLGSADREQLSRVVLAAATGVRAGCTLTLAQAHEPATLDFAVSPVLDQTGRVSLLSVEATDTSQRTRVEAQLKSSEALYTALFDSTADGLFVVSRESGMFRFREVNPAFETASGIRRAQLLGRRPLETLPAPAGTEMESMLQRCMLGSGAVAFDTGFDRQGERRYWAVSLAALPGDALSSATVIGSARDVTEARAQQDALMQAQKMEAVGQMTGGIAHDFNNLLTVIAGNLDLIEMRLTRGGQKPEEGVTRTIASAQRAAERAESLTQQLLAFSRKQPLQPIPVDLNVLIDEAQDLLARSVGETVVIVKVKQPNLPICTADPHQLEVALLNLALNARDAMPEGGALTIATAYRSLKPAEAKRLDLSPGEYVMLTVSDTGTGMPSEVAAHAFDPFFTTKEAGRGSGLGLSMVYGFVKQSRGHVALASTVGRGTSVTLYLPCQLTRRAAAEAPLPPPPLVLEPGSGGETVLVVEDDLEVLKFASSVLEELGYRVLSAENGATALDRLDAEHVDALFTDVVMAGGMSGIELARIAKERQPDLKVLFATGYAAEFAQQDSTVEPLRVLHKPYKRLPLAREIRQLLTGS
jgi:PAS domain S-box-containing protein